MKKTISLLLTAILLLGLLAVFPVSVGAAAVDQSWYNPDRGTEAFPYKMENAADWAGFVALANGTDTTPVDFNGKHFLLTNDINLTGYTLPPINQAKNTMQIHINGDGHSISGLVQSGPTNGGLFAFVSAGSTFEDLTLKNSTISASEIAGGFVAESDGDLSFRACRTENVTVSAANTAGGFVGYTDASSTAADQECLFHACVNEASVSVTSSGAANAGGFLGFGTHADHPLSVSFTYCVNRGSISVNGKADNNAVGGFVGQISSKNAVASYAVLEADHCYNVGTLTGNDGDYTVYMGGFLGLGSFGGELILWKVHDHSTRSWQSGQGKGGNGGLVGSAANSECVKRLIYCLAVNYGDNTTSYVDVYAGARNASTLMTLTSCVLTNIKDTVNLDDTAASLKSETERIDEAIAHAQNSTVGEHMFQNACDEFCDLCGIQRFIPGHEYLSLCDPYCGRCGAVRETSHDHSYDAVCDPNCNACGTQRKNVTHSYKSDCADHCSVCNTYRTPQVKHEYSGTCDTVCNQCEHERNTSIKHSYLNETDEDCQVCGYVRDLSTEESEEVDTETSSGSLTVTLPKPNDKTDKKQQAQAAGCGASLGAGGISLALLCLLGTVCVRKKKEL